LQGKNANNPDYIMIKPEFKGKQEMLRCRITLV